MRYATAAVTWDENMLHPMGEGISSDPDVDIDKVYYSNRVDENTYTELCQFQGDIERVRTHLERAEKVRQYEIPADSDGLGYVHFEGSPLLDSLMDALFEHAVVLKWPIDLFTDEDRCGGRVTVLGTETTIAGALGEVPPEVDLTLERTGQFRGTFTEPLASLTDRQREVLDAALSSGYYDLPRETTQAELADQLDLSPATVGEHIRRIESNLISTLTA